MPLDPSDVFVSPLSASESQGAVEGIARPSAARPLTELDIRARLARLGRAERDCIELHKALGEAIRRISVHSRLPDKLHRAKPIGYADLMVVLERTSREGN